MAITVIYGVLKNCSYMLSPYRSDRHRHTVRQTAWRININRVGGLRLDLCFMNHPPRYRPGEFQGQDKIETCLRQMM